MSAISISLRITRFWITVPRAKAPFPRRASGEHSERHVGRLGDAHDGLVASHLLPGRTDRLDLLAILLRVRIVDDEHLGAKALGRGLALALPLSAEVGDAK